MKGTVAPDVRSCTCGNKKWNKETFRGMTYFSCSACGADPKFFRIRRYMPGTNGKGGKMDIRYDHNQKRLTTVAAAHAMLTYLDSMISSQKFDPFEFRGQASNFFAFENFVNQKYLPYYEALMNRGEYKPSSMAAKKQYLRNHLLPYFKGRSIKDFSKQIIERMYSNLTASPRMKDLIAQELKRILNFAKAEGYITEVPAFPKQKKAKLKDPEKLLTQEEQEKVISLIDDEQYKVMIKILSCTGLRPSEVRPLKWSDWDLKTGTLWIRRHVTFRSQVVPGRKSSDDLHSVAITPELAAIYEQLSPPANRDDYMFKGAKGEICSEHCLSRAWRRAILKTDHQYVDLYRGTKSSLLSQMLRAGHSISQIAVAAGLSEEVVSRYAQHNSNSKRKIQMELMSRANGGGGGLVAHASSEMH